MFIYWGKDEYNKQNLVEVWGECAHCGRICKLSSYDATIRDHLYGVPVSKGQRLHFHDSCALCQHSAQIPIEQWAQAVDEQLIPAVEDYLNQTDDPELAARALQATVEFSDPQEFDRIANHIEMNFPEDAEALGALADGCALFYRVDDATALYSKSLLIQDDPGLLYRLTYHLLYHAQVDDAHDEVKRYIDTGDEYAKPICMLYATACQAIGRNRDALNMLEHLLERQPDLASDREFTEKLDLARRYQNTEKKIGGNELAIGAANKVPATKKDRKIGAIIVLGLIIAGAGVYLFACITARPTVFLVGGAKQAYTVMINQKKFTIPVMKKPYEIDMDWGNIELSAASDGPAITPGTLKMELSFFKRAFSHPTYVINPDKGAAIVWVEAYYSSNPPPSKLKGYIGDTFYTFWDIDFNFKPLPQSVSSKSSMETRRALELWDPAQLNSP